MLLWSKSNKVHNINWLQLLISRQIQTKRHLACKSYLPLIKCTKKFFSRHSRLLLQSLNTHTCTHPSPLQNDNFFAHKAVHFHARGLGKHLLRCHSHVPIPAPVKVHGLSSSSIRTHQELVAPQAPRWLPEFSLTSTSGHLHGNSTISAHFQVQWRWERSQAATGSVKTSGLRGGRPKRFHVPREKPNPRSTFPGKIPIPEVQPFVPADLLAT